MGLKQMFFTIFQSLNPESHKELREQKMGFVLKYFFFILVVCLAIMFLLFIPTMLSLNSFVSDATAGLGSIATNFSFTITQPFNLVQDPVIAVEPQFNNMSNARILIAQDGIYYRQFIFFGKQSVLPIENGVDFKQDSHARLQLVSLFWLLLPSIIFWSIILFAIYFLAIIIITYALFLLFCAVFRIHLSPLSLLKTCFFSSTILIALQLILMPFYRLFLIPIVAYWILLLIIVLLLKDETALVQRSGPTAGSGKAKNLFAGKESVDVDNDGNISHSPKKKRSFNEENEGFVEWK